DAAGGVTERVVGGQYLIRDGTTYRLVRDHVGSIRLVVNTASGGVAQRLDYDEFGRVLGDTSPGFQPLGFAGGLYDPDTGLVRFGSRGYDRQTGRWLTKDRVGFEGGQANVYLYVNGDPVNRFDPQGLDAAHFLLALGTALVLGFDTDPDGAVFW